jgi:hypothetical protein
MIIFTHLNTNIIEDRISYQLSGESSLSDEKSEIEPDINEDWEPESTDIPEGDRKIFTDKGDPEITSLYDRSKRGKMVLQPDFQRHFVWDAGKSSRLIESAILDIPLPVIYLSEEKDGKEYVIDGQQRLTAFFSFIDGKFPSGTVFKLTGLRVLKDLNNKLFSELNEDTQDKIKCCKIRTITFKRESNPELKFEIFERLNTGAVSLNDQELRNCIYRGKFNDLLKELSQDPDFRFILDLNQPEKRMKDVELVLRFAAFYHKNYLNYKAPIKNFLNSEMIDYRQIDDAKAEELRKAFKMSVGTIRSVLGKNAFKRYYKGSEKNPNGHWESKQFNYSLYDILMWSFSRIDRNKVYPNIDAIKEGLIDLMTTDESFINSIELSTSSQKAVTIRFDKWRKILEELIDVTHREPRCFSRQLKQEMFEKNPTCAICGGTIMDVDDSAIDHVEQWWRGGKTIPENARLTHRYCNWSRPRYD